MKLENYYPSFRQVLFKEVLVEKKTDGGIILPSKGVSFMTHSDIFDKEKEHKIETPGDYVVVKVGEDCTKIKIGDVIVVNSQPTPIMLEDKGSYFQINEGLIIGYARV